MVVPYLGLLFSGLAPVEPIDRVLAAAGAGLVQEEQPYFLQECDGFVDGLAGEAGLLRDLSGVQLEETVLV